MKKYLLCVLLFSGAVAFAQHQEPSCFIAKGYCSDVVKDLQAQSYSDSIIVDYIRKNYVIVNSPKASRLLRGQNYRAVMAFFSQEENKKIRCYHRYFSREVEN